MEISEIRELEKENKRPCNHKEIFVHAKSKTIFFSKEEKWKSYTELVQKKSC